MLGRDADVCDFEVGRSFEPLRTEVTASAEPCEERSEAVGGFSGDALPVALDMKLVDTLGELRLA